MNKKGIIGAVIGDIVGSRFEWTNCRSTDFEFLNEHCSFTDDTVMTMAVADWLTVGGNLPGIMRDWGRDYPNIGYGGMFYQWLYEQKDDAPYNSFGNGAGMRVSPCGFFSHTLDETLDLAKQSAEVTHNHPEGIKGAQAIASAIFLARTGKSKEEIKFFIEKTFHYDLNRTCDEIRPTYEFNETCQGSCPEAIIAFLESRDYESAIRLAISLGGDSDTIACMTGGIAAAYYGVPDEILENAKTYLPNVMIETILNFERVIADTAGSYDIRKRVVNKLKNTIMSLFDIFTKKRQSNAESFDLSTIVQCMFDENGITPHRHDNVFITDIDGVHCSFQTVLKCDSANPTNLFIYTSFPIPISKHVSDIVTLELERLNECNKQVEITMQERDGEYSVFAYTDCNFEKAPTTDDVKALMIHTIDAMDNDNFRSIACAIFGFASYKEIEKAIVSNARIEGREANIQMEDGYRMLHEHSEGITSSRYAGRLLVFASHIITDRISQEHTQQLLDDQTPMWKIIQEAYNVADEEERDVVRKLKYLTLYKQPNPDCDNDRNSMFGRLEATHMIANDKYLLLGNEAGL